MVYNKNLVVVVKSEGKVLREDGEKVYLPVGSEYSLMVKNLNSRRALVSIFIDGEDVLDGHGLIVPPNGTESLERFFKNGDLNKGKKFKFIEKTQKISDYRGDRVDDGIIHIEYRFEAERPSILREQITLGGDVRYSHEKFSPSRGIGGQSTGNPVSQDVFYSSSRVGEYLSNSDVVTASCSTATAKSVDGITVEGSESSQSFTYGHIGTLESTMHVINFQLVGVRNDAEVTKPVTVKTKLTCKTCGTVHKSNVKFCRECGTSLI